MARDEVPARVIIAELVCPAVLLALNFSFLASIPSEFGRGFLVVPMLLAEAVVVVSAGLIAHVCLFLLFPQLSHGTAQRALWAYIFVGIWFRVLAFCSLLALLAGSFSWCASIRRDSRPPAIRGQGLPRPATRRSRSRPRATAASV